MVMEGKILLVEMPLFSKGSGILKDGPLKQGLKAMGYARPIGPVNALTHRGRDAGALE